ncbi:hypothetical protein EMIT0324P_30154 [Pseudomonas chlororaphis]
MRRERQGIDTLLGKRFDYSHNSIKYYDHNSIETIDNIEWRNPAYGALRTMGPKNTRPITDRPWA